MVDLEGDIFIGEPQPVARLAKEFEAKEIIGAEKYERSTWRMNHRNGQRSVALRSTRGSSEEAFYDVRIH